MSTRRSLVLLPVSGLVALIVLAVPVIADQFMGTVQYVDTIENHLIVKSQEDQQEYKIQLLPVTQITKDGQKTELKELKKGDEVEIQHEKGVAAEIKVKSKQKQEAKKKGEEAKKKEEEAKKKEEEAKKKGEEAQKKLEEAQHKEEEAKKQEEESKKQKEESKKQEEAEGKEKNSPDR